MSLPRIAAVIAIALAVSACSSSEPPAGGPSATTAATPPAATTPTVPSSNSGGQEATGIAVCDEFLAAYEQCLVDKVPTQAREQMLTGVAQWRQAWQDMAGNAASRDSLPQVCQQAREASRPALQAYGCAL